MNSKCVYGNSKSSSYEYIRNNFFFTIILLQLLLHLNLSHAITWKENPHIRIKNYYTLLEESKTDPKCFEKYQEKTLGLINRETPGGIWVLLQTNHPQGIQQMFFIMTYNYLKKYNFYALNYKKPSSFHLKFRNIDGLFKDMAAASYDPSLEMLRNYKRFANEIERRNRLSISKELRRLLHDEKKTLEHWYPPPPYSESNPVVAYD